LTLLVASEICDGLEPEVGLSEFSLVFALILATLIVSLMLMLGYDVLQWPPVGSRSPSRATATAALMGLGVGPLVLIGVAHLHHRPDAAAWLGTTGAALMLAAALANHRDAGGREPL